MPLTIPYKMFLFLLLRKLFRSSFFVSALRKEVSSYGTVTRESDLKPHPLLEKNKRACVLVRAIFLHFSLAFAPARPPRPNALQILKFGLPPATAVRGGLRTEGAKEKTSIFCCRRFRGRRCKAWRAAQYAKREHYNGPISPKLVPPAQARPPDTPAAIYSAIYSAAQLGTE